MYIYYFSPTKEYTFVYLLLDGLMWNLAQQ